IKAWVGRLNNEAGGPGYLLGSLAGAGWCINNQKIKPHGFLKRLFSRGEVLNPNARLNLGGKAATLPSNACPLLNVEVGDLGAESGLRRFAGKATGQSAFPDPAFLGHKRDNRARLIVFGRIHKKLSPANCKHMPTIANS